MNKWLVILVVSLLAWVQIYFLGALSGGYLAINLVVIAIAAIASTRSLSLAVAAAIIGGFWIEVVSVNNFGSRILFLLLLVLGIKASKRAGLLIESRGIFVLVCSTGALLYSVWLLFWVWFDLGLVSWPSQLFTIMLVEVIIVALLAYVTFKPLNKLISGGRYG